MEIKEAYDKILSRVLEPHGLSDWYIGYGEYDKVYDEHEIGRITEKPIIFMGRKLWSTKKREIVARVTSEPKQAKSQHTSSRLKYDGLEIHIRNETHKSQIIDICRELETELKEPVKLVA